MEFTVEIVPEESTIYIGEDNSSMASYLYLDDNDIADIIKEYIRRHGEI